MKRLEAVLKIVCAAAWVASFGLMLSGYWAEHLLLSFGMAVVFSIASMALWTVHTHRIAKREKSGDPNQLPLLVPPSSTDRPALAMHPIIAAHPALARKLLLAVGLICTILVIYYNWSIPGWIRLAMFAGLILATAYQVETGVLRDCGLFTVRRISVRHVFGAIMFVGLALPGPAWLDSFPYWRFIPLMLFSLYCQKRALPAVEASP
jgi:hypothetical protein